MQQNTIKELSLSHTLFSEEQKLWLLLLNYAKFHDKINYEEEYSMALEEIFSAYSCNDEKTLKLFLTRMMIIVYYTTFSRNGFFSIFDSIRVFNGICFYRYSRLFVRVMYDAEFTVIKEFLAKNLEL